MTALEDELRHLIVDALVLEDLSPADIKADDPLFVDGLGLDSIDALELAMAVERRFGIRFAADESKNRSIFRSVRSLAEHIAQSRLPSTGAL